MVDPDINWVFCRVRTVDELDPPKLILKLRVRPVRVPLFVERKEKENPEVTVSVISLVSKSGVLELLLSSASHILSRLFQFLGPLVSVWDIPPELHIWKTPCVDGEYRVPIEIALQITRK